MNAKAPVFPANTRWSTPTGFRPLEVNDTIKNMLAETLVRNDNAIRQVLRQCKDKWIFAVTLGKDTIDLKVFDPKEVDQSHLRPMSSSINRQRTSFFEIDRELNIRQLSVERVDEVMRTAPMLYADRALTRDEVSTCDSIVRTMTTDDNLSKTLPLTDLVHETYKDRGVFDDLRPDFTLEPA